MAKKEKNAPVANCRLNKVGGQAVLEGVMMKAGARTVTTCRKENGELVVTDGSFVSVREKHKILNLPLIRGVVNFIEMMLLSFKTLNISAEAMELDDEKDKQKKAEGKASTTDIVMIIGAILGVVLAITLFMVLPGYAAEGISYLFSLMGVTVNATVKAIIEGISKIAIFLGYLALVSLMPDIKRTFMYHGAEHKSIACFEAGEELTPENAKKHTRFHPRCGTSFMFFMILIGVIVGIILNNIFSEWPRILIILVRLALLPLVVGIGYEFIMFAGKHDNFIVRALSAPGLWVQRITTKEPTEDMLEVAITSIKCALRDEFEEFKEFYESKAWIKEAPENEENAGEENKEADTDKQNADASEESADAGKSNAEGGEFPKDAEDGNTDSDGEDK